MTSWTDIIVSVIISGGLASLLTWYLQWRKAKPEIASMYQELSAKQIAQIDDLLHRVHALEEQVQEQNLLIHRLQAKIKEYDRGIRILLHQLAENEIVPSWQPPEDNQEEAQWSS